MKHTDIKPDMPAHLFVGVMDGPSTCTPDEQVYDIWPKFLTIVLLQGAQHFLIDNASFQIDAGFGDRCEPVILMLNVARYAKLRFINESNVPLRKINISAPLPWIEKLAQPGSGEPSPLRSFFSHHLAQFTFRPGKHILTVAEQIMTPPAGLDGELLSLHRHSRGLTIMSEACGALTQEAVEQAGPKLLKRRQAERIRDHVLATLDREVTIKEIAEAVGMSVSAAQRAFRDCFGTTVFGFIRDQRLARAAVALNEEGATIAQAAFIAGYSDPSHFSSAFKRAYGTPPSTRRK
ncbi:helix-turn-helix domain-containing protein [Tianweitania populi]|uniref:HTH araC/xylS-type domain-containing protein n=1 Tax=Tianweitania populi TaxID=1607949 RepID=A0A8J3DKP0_9HYPH|nr:AraC family transcriptional regulator [Tianweitania populi]GHD05088.1 hypothetical protein GCM10016234_00640 [Tianweitania populi]